jgi:hypothetical protein
MRVPDIRFSAFLTAFALLWAVDSASLSSGALAQDPADLCGFDVCGLRIESGSLLFGFGGEVLRGAEGTVVSKVGRTDELLTLFSAVDSAAHHYARFEAKDLQAQRIARLGAVTWLVGLGLMYWENSADGLQTAGIVLNLGGAAVMLGSLWPRRAGRDELGKAVWWYNRSLPRGP